MFPLKTLAPAHAHTDARTELTEAFRNADVVGYVFIYRKAGFGSCTADERSRGTRRNASVQPKTA